jgi:signal transduction histidine kinase
LGHNAHLASNKAISSEQAPERDERSGVGISTERHPPPKLNRDDAPNSTRWEEYRAILSGGRRAAWLRYGAAVAAVAVALALKLLLVPLVTYDEPFLLFFAAVIASAVFGGLGPGLLATALATLLDGYFFMMPYHKLALQSADQGVRLALFAGECVLISMIAARLKFARQRAEINAEAARILEKQILEISDDEQRRIGHDLHDGLGQHLTGIALMTRRLQQRLASENSPETNEAVKLSQLAKTAVEWTHDLCRTLSPPVMASGGLADGLRGLAGNAESLFDIECVVEQSGEFNSIDLAAAMHLYRIAQEAISNAVRHGQARNITLRLENSGSNIAMQIIDDGTGIKLGAGPVEGMGLSIMRYRARMIGATIDIRRGERGGTIVTCRYNAAG